MKQIFWIFIFFINCSFFGTPYGFSRLYFASDYYSRSYKETFLEHIQGKQHDFLKGYQIGYDRFQPNSLYWGGSLYQTKASDREKTDDETFTGKQKYYNYDGKLGLTLCLGSVFIIPYAGIGYSKWVHEDIPESNQYEAIDYKWTYFIFGVQSIIFVWKTLEVGIKVQIMPTLNGSVHVKDLTFTVAPSKYDLAKKSSYEISLPIYYHPFKWQCLDIAFVPYYKEIKMEDGDTRFIYQSQLHYGPDAISKEKGVKIEAGLRF